MNKRIWELDAIRGLLMILIMAYHLFYDLVFLFSVVKLDTPFLLGLYRFCNDWLGSPFLLLSGICVTLGNRPVRRGLQVIGGGMLITIATVGLYLIGFAGKDIIIYFGVLHCLGTCMLLWSLAKKLPTGLLLALGITLAAIGLYIKGCNIRVGFDYLAPLGLISRNFASSDYFPLLPNLGYFLVGAFIGRTVYRKKVSLLPNIAPVRPLCFIGRNSLLLYLIHQPILAAAVYVWALIF